ncbi:hypothetical protein LR68_04352 [Anoxybacillus sp. BCO1]|uniref:hypothetical protein n=1 Tax=Anoxybacillus sp. MB8 TaxID=2496850 RepID=UPI000541ED1C|nr:hypothetical protein [Anoxybacillus sp. MB8]KHF26827.1 hypothetical protein LR68_04352 [Anoxybacillus sp. BCO1]
MYHYAELNHENICIGVKTVKDVMTSTNLIPIDEANPDFLFRKFENGNWSLEKYLPDAAAIQLSEFEKLKQENTELKQRQQIIQQALDDLLLGGM